MVSDGERLPIPPPEQAPGPPLEPGLHTAYVDLMRRCWAQDPAERPGFGDVIVALRGMMARLVGAAPAGGSPR